MTATATQLTLTDTEIEVFGVGVLKAYQHRDYFMEDWAYFVGQTAGEVINVPIVQEGEATNKPDGEAHTSGGAELVGVEIALVEPVKSYVDIKKTQVDIRPDLNLLSNVGQQLGRDVGIGRSLRIANHLMFEADAEGNTITDDYVTQSGMGDAVKNGIAAIMAEMDEAGVDEAMRFGLMKPTQFYSMRGVAEVISSDFTQGQNINQAIGGNMAMVQYLNCLIRNMGGIFGVDWTHSLHAAKNLPSDTGFEMEFDASSVVGLFWHHDAWAVRHQTGLQADVPWIPCDQVWMPIARLHMGVKVIKIEGLWLLVHSS